MPNISFIPTLHFRHPARSTQKKLDHNVHHYFRSVIYHRAVCEGSRFCSNTVLRHGDGKDTRAKRPWTSSEYKAEMRNERENEASRRDVPRLSEC
ncbi:unnamed protein product [Soboliphyme baturini]|uniref:Peptidylprolyl isomerase n=1 Tax=Soboliphyme baturini TaxID=241478 RepID=A0A183IKU1_9BILA|nr:unnamed protein product [Soboliphyme baturini]